MPENPAPPATALLRDQIAHAFVMACEDELRAPKPGNVHLFAGGHGMEAQDFIDSARAAAGPLTAGAGVGERIFGAVEATWARVAQNTNLGIVLLCAPLVEAALAQGALTQAAGGLRESVLRVLRELTRDDADLAFRAISRANPGGLGAAPEHDVAGPATATLLDAMRAAAHRDRIAFQYANGFADIFDTGFPTLALARAKGLERPLATLLLYAKFLSAFPDSHVARKFGAAAAGLVMEEARRFRILLEAAPNQDEAFAAALRWDRSLKARGLNPGTSADLTVATLFAEYVSRILANADKNG
jgi:triphosphoribosyl-dephospho-CoA synthase